MGAGLPGFFTFGFEEGYCLTSEPGDGGGNNLFWKPGMPGVVASDFIFSLDGRFLITSFELPGFNGFETIGG